MDIQLKQISAKLEKVENEVKEKVKEIELLGKNAGKSSEYQKRIEERRNLSKNLVNSLICSASKPGNIDKANPLTVKLIKKMEAVKNNIYTLSKNSKSAYNL